MTSDGISHNLAILRSVYLTLHIAGGHIGLPILVSTFFLSKRVHRPATVINFCITWIIYSVSYTLLFYGGYHNSVEPPSELCFAQAAMIHGSPPMAAIAGFGVVMQAYTAYQLPWQNWHPKWISRLPGWLITTAIVLPPYLVFIAFASTSAVLGLHHAADISPKEHLRIYCTFKQSLGPLQFAVPGFCASVLAGTVTLEAVAIVKYCRGWLTIKRVFPLVMCRPSLSPLFRVSLFSLYSLAVLGACISYLTHNLNYAVDMIQAALPLIATIIFATQTDVMSAWAFWKRERVCDAIQDPAYVPGGGWSRPTSQDLSPSLTGHVSLSSHA
ncbi:hypothetical protein BC835DRAFT_1409746 [Cytidiella melzeri]|nr:hypothetical protein BC835DRAFT_1409746 [Cytidiella melzeri]